VAIIFPPHWRLGVAPANLLAQEEVFGPVLATMTFRNIEEAVELANNTRYGLAASVWSENLNVALDVAPGLKAGVVWINGTNMFDAACGFGGYRESGFGREGGKEGMYEYLVRGKRRWGRPIKAAIRRPAQHLGRTLMQLGSTARQSSLSAASRCARTATIPYPVTDRKASCVVRRGLAIARISAMRCAAARACKAWPDATAYNRSQVLYFLAENLSGRAD
jgi:aldehyde dehydrogenase (NAD+)